MAFKRSAVRFRSAPPFFVSRFFRFAQTLRRGGEHSPGRGRSLGYGSRFFVSPPPFLIYASLVLDPRFGKPAWRLLSCWHLGSGQNRMPYIMPKVSSPSLLPLPPGMM